MRKSIVLLLLCALCCTGKGHAQLPSDSVRIYYRQGHRHVDPAFGDNRRELDRFLHSIRRACELGHVDRLVIRAYASPDGTNRANERLSGLRTDSIEGYVLRHTAIPAAMIEKHAEGIAWDQLRRMAATSDRMPHRDEVLEILDNTPLWIVDDAGRIVDGRKKRLMSLRGGVPYNYMLEHLFPALRNSLAVSLYTKDYGAIARTAAETAKAAAESATAAAAAAAASAERAEAAAASASRLAGQLESLAGTLDPAAAGEAVTVALNAAAEARAAARTASEAAAGARAAAAEAATAAADAVATEQRSDSEDAAEAAESAEAEARTAAGAEADARAAEKAARAAAETAGDAAARVAEAEAALRDATTGTEPVAADPLHRLAVKTNLIYDALLMPSLEVEYRIDDRWSVALEGDVAWWRNKAKHQYYQVAAIVPEGRYWFSAREPWHGHYVGLFAGGTWYDLENGGTGYRGEAFLTGVSYGYMWPVSRSLSLEAGVGIGYAYTKYEQYHPKDNHYLYQQTRRTHYFGPLKLKLALVWRLWDKNKEKGGAR